MRNRLLAAAALTCAASSPAAFAEPVAAFVDLYYIPYTQLETSVSDGDTEVSRKVDGDGYGVKGLLRVADHIALDGEYQQSKYDGSADRDNWRAGAGYYWRYFGVAANYIDESFDDGESKVNADGVGLYARTSYLATELLAFTGGLGYLRLDGGGNSYDGFEYNAGLDFRMTSTLGVFADYRYADLKDDGIKLRLGEARVGLRLVF